MTFKRALPPRREREPGEFDSFVPKPRAAVMAASLHEATPTEAPKAVRHESTAWRRAVASLPCVLCGKVGETQCAHRNEGKGMATKTDDALTAALCMSCHRDIDQGSQHTRAERRERLDRAILKTIALLAREGLVKAA